jgi:FlaA1/EpsC-like NDP-sugar epimerase
MPLNLKNINFWTILITDVLFAIVHLLSYLVRFEGRLTPAHWQNIKLVIVWLLIGKVAVFYWFGLYQGMWRYSGLVDMMAALKASIVVTAIAVSVVLMMTRFQGFSRSVFVLDGVFTFLAACGVRFSIRMYHQKYSIGQIWQSKIFWVLEMPARKWPEKY